MGKETPKFLVPSVVPGWLVGQWSRADHLWVDVNEAPSTGNPRELLALLGNTNRTERTQTAPAAAFQAIA